MRKTVFIKFFTGIFCFISFSGILSGQTGVTPKDKQILARINIDVRMEFSGLPVYAHLQSADGEDYILVKSYRSDLEKSGVDYIVLDEILIGKKYLIALERKSGVRQHVAQRVKILMDDGQHILVCTDQKQADQIAAMGMDIYWLPDKPVVIRDPVLSAFADRYNYHALVDGMLDSITETKTYNLLAGLSGEIPVTIGGQNYTIKTRNTYSGTPVEKATQYAYEFMKKYGLEVNYQNYTTTNFNNRNVVAEIPGKINPEEIIVIGAHLDDAPETGPAPGAEDNGSGTVAVMLAASVLSHYNFEKTIRFVCFTGEEQGLHGSNANAETSANAGEKIIGMFNLDMVSYESDGNHTYNLRIRKTTDPGYPGDLVIAQAFENIVSLYKAKIDLIPTINPAGGGSSDHMRYWDQGFSAVGSMSGEFTPYYHESTDVISTCNMKYFSYVIRGVIAMAAHIAIPIENIMITNFQASHTSSCTGDIQFTDKSLNPQTWLWDFGDGNTSASQNPVHYYIADGTYTVQLTATNQYGADTETKSNYITIDLPAPPATTNGQGKQGETVTLLASGNGTLDWYDQPTGGTKIFTGTSFITPPLQQTTTYYVEDVVQSTPVHGGAPDNQIGSGGNFTNNDQRGLFFNVLKKATLKSVKVYAGTTGERKIEVLKGSDTGPVYLSKTVNIASGESRVNLDFEMEQGTGYFIKITGSVIDLYRNSDGASYPYPISNSMVITESNAGSPGYYYFFYDWEITEAACISARVPVTANITTTGINDNSTYSDEINIYPNPNNGTFSLVVQTDSPELLIRVTDMKGQLVYKKIESGISAAGNISITIDNLSKGLYHLQIFSGKQLYHKKIIVK